MNEFSENKLIEQTAVKIFGELWGIENFANAYSVRRIRNSGERTQTKWCL